MFEAIKKWSKERKEYKEFISLTSYKFFIALSNLMEEGLLPKFDDFNGSSLSPGVWFIKKKYAYREDTGKKYIRSWTVVLYL